MHSRLRSTAFAALLSMAVLAAPAVSASAQMGGMPMGGDKPGKPPLSPAAEAHVTLEGQTVTIKYNAPSMRGRTIMGGLVPYGQVWRTGANPATTLITPVSLHIGSLLVPAGEYTLYTLPSAGKWMLIVNKHTGQWGTEYYPAEDLGRVELKGDKLDSAQEVMSLSFDSIEKSSAKLHIRWEKTDQSVKISTP